MGLNALLGEPLDRIIYFVGHKAFEYLYLTGDKVLQSRIVKSPLICSEIPSYLSMNVVGLEDCTMLDTTRMQKGNRWKSYERMLLGGLPSTLKSLEMVYQSAYYLFSEDQLSCLTNYRISSCSMMTELERTFPPTITKLTIPNLTQDVANVIPDSVTALSLDVEDNIKSTVDMTKCKFTTFQYEGSLRVASLTFPRSITILLCMDHYVTQDLPNLEYVHCNSISGKATLPKLKRAFVYDDGETFERKTCQFIPWTNHHYILDVEPEDGVSAENEMRRYGSTEFYSLMLVAPHRSGISCLSHPNYYEWTPIEGFYINLQELLVNFDYYEKMRLGLTNGQRERKVVFAHMI